MFFLFHMAKFTRLFQKIKILINYIVLNYAKNPISHRLLVNNRVSKNDAKVVAIPGLHVEIPRHAFLSHHVAAANDNKHPLGTINWRGVGMGLNCQTKIVDDSPFYFGSCIGTKY
jgi:hypothetical protein